MEGRNYAVGSHALRYCPKRATEGDGAECACRLGPPLDSRGVRDSSSESWPNAAFVGILYGF